MGNSSTSDGRYFAAMAPEPGCVWYDYERVNQVPPLFQGFVEECVASAIGELRIYDLSYHYVYGIRVACGVCIGDARWVSYASSLISTTP